MLDHVPDREVRGFDLKTPFRTRNFMIYVSYTVLIEACGTHPERTGLRMSSAHEV